MHEIGVCLKSTLIMDKLEFITHFNLVLVHLNDFTSQFCYNKLTSHYKFIIEPSCRNVSDHLTKEENAYLKTWNRVKDMQLSFEQVVNLFYKNGTVPKWADCSIYYASNKITVVHILFSRQFKDEGEIYYLDYGTGPFKAVMVMPPEPLRVMKDDKFDLNWKKRLNDRKGNILQRIKSYFECVILPGK